MIIYKSNVKLESLIAFLVTHSPLKIPELFWFSCKKRKLLLVWGWGFFIFLFLFFYLFIFVIVGLLSLKTQEQKLKGTKPWILGAFRIELRGILQLKSELCCKT